MKGELNRTIMIYVDSYDNEVITGRFHIVSNEETIPFHSLSQLLLGINNYLDKENFPQSFSSLRKFNLPRKESDFMHTSRTSSKGLLATFSIRLLFRQNASWQGVITWVENNVEEYFRSVLELIMLLDNALSIQKDQ